MDEAELRAESEADGKKVAPSLLDSVSACP